MEQKTSAYVFLAGTSSIRLRPQEKEFAAGLTPRQSYGEKLQSALYKLIVRLYAEGHRTFSATLEKGFGLEAANLIQMIRENNPQCPGIRLQVYYVYDGQHAHYDGFERALFEDLVHKANSVEVSIRGVLPTKEQYIAMQQELNRSLASNSSLLVCYDDATEEPITTMRNKSQEAGIPIINLFDQLNNKTL